MPEKVLILAPEDDSHARALGCLLERDFDTETFIWDLRRFPVHDTLSLELASTQGDCQINVSQHGRIALRSLRSICWRRAGLYQIDPAISDTEVRRFCVRECESLFKGILSASKVPIINAFEAEGAANRKPLQLITAQRAGLAIPKTILSNDREEIENFCAGVPSAVYKAFTPPVPWMAETRVLKVEDFDDLAKVRYAPVIVQEKIEKGRDVRVNIFGQRIFAAEVTTRHPAADLDWRLDLSAVWSEHNLPCEVGRQLIELLRLLGLHYGCIDLRQQADGAYVFLEVNPSGQFLFIEIDTGQPLLRALAELLLEPSICSEAFSVNFAAQTMASTASTTPDCLESLMSKQT